MVSTFLKILYTFLIWVSIGVNVVPETLHRSDFVLCRLCGTDLASSHSVVNRLTPAAESKRNDTLFGLDNVQIQVVLNSFKIPFNIITVVQGTCTATGQWQVEDSWYPGYAWKACFCSHCNHHLGWLFEPLATAASDRKFSSTKGFYGIILDHVISEQFSNSLLATPKYSFHLRKHQEL